MQPTIAPPASQPNLAHPRTSSPPAATGQLQNPGLLLWADSPDAREPSVRIGPLGAGAAVSRTLALLDHVVIYPLRDQPACLIHRRFRVMDAIKRCTGHEGGHVVGPQFPEFRI